MALALVFWAGLWAAEGETRAGEFLAGNVVEKSLSVDNIFVFALLFSYFAVPPALQHRVLLWGVVMALVMGGVFIAVGAALLAAFHWMIYVFGGFLVITGIRLATHKDEEVHPERNFRAAAAAPDDRDHRGLSRTRLFVYEERGRRGTPLLAVVVAVATTDLLFALDSIPAVFTLTNLTFIVFAGNAFALLGLRALFFRVVGVLRRFIYLKGRPVDHPRVRWNQDAADRRRRQGARRDLARRDRHDGDHDHRLAARDPGHAGQPTPKGGQRRLAEAALRRAAGGAAERRPPTNDRPSEQHLPGAAWLLLGAAGRSGFDAPLLVAAPVGMPCQFTA